MLIHKDALVVSEATTDNVVRYFLNAACFDKEGRAIATNGHVLLRFTSKASPDAVAEAEPSKDVLIGADDLKIISALLPKSQQHSGGFLRIVPNGDHVTVGFGDEHRGVEVRARNIEATFPDAEKIAKMLAPSGEVSHRVILSPDLLMMVARAAKQCGVRALHFDVRGDGAGKSFTQLVFSGEAQNGTLDGAIMPMTS